MGYLWRRVELFTVRVRLTQAQEKINKHAYMLAIAKLLTQIFSHFFLCISVGMLKKKFSYCRWLMSYFTYTRHGVVQLCVRELKERNIIKIDIFPKNTYESEREKKS